MPNVPSLHPKQGACSHRNGARREEDAGEETWDVSPAQDGPG